MRYTVPMIEAVLEDVAVAGDGSQFIVLLKAKDEDESIVAIWIGALEAMSIVAGRGGEFPRPMSHDLMLSMLEMLDAEVVRVEVTDIADGTFYARLIVENRGVEFEIDARPSDALALAVRVDAPLYIAEKVIEQTAMTDFPSGAGGAEA